jgi:hypothetical protein
LLISRGPKRKSLKPESRALKEIFHSRKTPLDTWTLSLSIIHHSIVVVAAWTRRKRGRDVRNASLQRIFRFSPVFL